MAEPVVDVGIPVFERDSWVGQAIRSVRDQTYPHWRLTVSEDGPGSTAVRKAVEPHLVDGRVRHVVAGEHLGLARHKTTLAARGDGSYLALLDDDDLWEPPFLERRVRFLESHPRSVLVWGGHLDVDEKGGVLGLSPLPFAGGEHGSGEFVRAMMAGNLVATPSVVMRREAYARAGGRFDERFVHINDYELWLRLGMTGPVGFLAVHDCRYRVHAGQMSRRHDRALDHLRLIDHLDALLREWHPELRLTAAERRRHRAERLLSVALDAAEEGRRGLAARRIVEAVTEAPGALVSPRGLGAVLATSGGARIRRLVGSRRT